MTAKTTRDYLDNYGKKKPVPEERPTQPRTMRMKPTHINTVTCGTCLGARFTLFQWWGQQVCEACDGTGESDQ